MARQPRRAPAARITGASPRDDCEPKAMRGSVSVACDGSALALVGGGGDVEMEQRARAEEDAPEAIDTDEDDAEFEERAHWGRRRVGAKKNGSKSAKRKAAEDDKSQPKINWFCVAQASAEERPRSSEGNDELPTPSTEALNTPAAVTPEQTSILNVRAEEKEDDGNGGSSVVEVVVQTVSSPTGVSAATPIDITSPTATVAATVTSASSPEVVLLSPTMLSGRPKRQAVMRAEQLQQASDEALFTTPPAGPPSTKNTSATSKATLDGEPERKATSSGIGSHCGLSNSGRKRKLEMAAGEKKPSSTSLQTKAPSKARPNVFFLTEEQKKQVIEIEAVALFKEQLRAQRERDLMFFGASNRDAVEKNPFFQARTSQKVIDVDAPEVIDVLDSPEPTKQRKSRWAVEPTPFPDVQHVQYEYVDKEDGSSTSEATFIPQKKAQPEPEGVVVVGDDDDEDMEPLSWNVAKQVFPDEADAQIPFGDAFWLLSATHTSDADEDFSLSADVSTDELIEKVAERYGVKEKRVRKTLAALESARSKRQDKALNLSLVDKYLPVQTAGMIGNNVPLKRLVAWLSAWKNGGANNDRSYDDSLFAFEGDESEEDEDGTQLYRLFILEGDVGAGKSAAVYACAEELGYEIIEINAGQLRTGKAVVDIAGEATQSTRVLHGGGPVNAKKSKKNKSKSKKRRMDDEAAKPSHLSLVLFEDVDLVFEEDKGFLSTLGSIAKHSKCPIVVTCRHLPDNFPSSPPAISERLKRPTTREFMAWVSLVANLEGIALSHRLTARLAELFACDIRRTLQFIQTYHHRFDLHARSHDASLVWKQHTPPQPIADTVTGTEADAPIAIPDSQDEEPLGHTVQRAPAWSRSTLRSFDLLSSNFLPQLRGSVCESVPLKAMTDEEKLRHVECLDDLWSALDGVSLADEWESVVAETHRRNAHNDDEGADFFHADTVTRLALDVRMLSLSTITSRRDRSADMLSLQECSLADGVDRALQAARDACERSWKATRLATLKTKLELPAIAKGSERVGSRFCMDYAPLVARIVDNSEPFQESRRRASRRNHYLGEVLLDMSAIDDLRNVQACFPVSIPFGGADDDEIVPQSASPPLTDATSISI